jgi:ferric hydroxamate transport system substrate-binding protein
MRIADLTRREVLLAGAMLGDGRASLARAVGRRVATVDWAILETLLALRVIPVAAAELILFREIAVEPKIPGGVVDLGLRGSVNFELLLACRPDLILNSSFYMSSEPRMRRIAPVATYSIYAPGARRPGLPSFRLFRPMQNGSCR